MPSFSLIHWMADRETLEGLQAYHLKVQHAQAEAYASGWVLEERAA